MSSTSGTSATGRAKKKTSGASARKTPTKKGAAKKTTSKPAKKKPKTRAKPAAAPSRGPAARSAPAGGAASRGRKKTTAKPVSRKKTTRASGAAGGTAPDPARETTRREEPPAPAADPLAALAGEVSAALSPLRPTAAGERPRIAPGPGLHYATCVDRVRTVTRLVVNRFQNWKRAA